MPIGLLIPLLVPSVIEDGLRRYKPAATVHNMSMSGLVLGLHV